MGLKGEAGGKWEMGRPCAGSGGAAGDGVRSLFYSSIDARCSAPISMPHIGPSSATGRVNRPSGP